MTEIQRISPSEAREKVRAGRALLVCAYADESKFAQYHLEGAISLADFKARLAALPREQEIIFYCNWVAENSAAGLAAEYNGQGFPHAKALLGGVKGWLAAGFPLL